jgi:hypothetical protein
MTKQLTTRNSRLTTRSGSTLLLSLLVMSTILVVAVSLSQLIAIEAALTRSNNETVVATYAAESALEQGAYRVRNTSDTTANLTGSSVLGNQASWTRSASNNIGALILRQLPKNLSRGFDFFDSDTPAAAGKESVKITIDSCDGTEWIELGYQQFNPTTFTFGNFQKFRYNCPAGSNSVIYNNGIMAASAYRLYVRYVQGTPDKLNRVTVVGCAADDGGVPCNLPGVVDITAIGSYRGSTRIMDLVMPRLSPVSGIFNYGVFSECQIIKDPTDPTPAC